ncbi:MAG: hypothetical protein N5P05_004526 (plasmid) [Chroococcopsis gigantea SAG 12.99]|nr:hypothetical protein [Chroococcopsis gigantea SAG 12.99]
MLPSIFQACLPRLEIEQGELSVELFAAELRSVLEHTAPQVYQNADLFFGNTYPTDGMKTLLSEVFSRLSNRSAGSPVIRLETSFCGGKTHNEIALWHICKKGVAIQNLEHFISLDLIPTQSIQVTAIDGRDLDPKNGVFHQDTGITTYTPWGEIAYQLGGVDNYDLLRGSDIKGISPVPGLLERLIKDRPTLIALDKIARYLRAAKAKTIENSDLAKQVVAFLFTLMVGSPESYSYIP